MATGICKSCNGDGRCPVCNGIGSFNVPAVGGGVETRRPCRACHCTAECRECQGHGRLARGRAVGCAR